MPVANRRCATAAANNDSTLTNSKSPRPTNPTRCWPSMRRWMNWERSTNRRRNWSSPTILSVSQWKTAPTSSASQFPPPGAGGPMRERGGSKKFKMFKVPANFPAIPVIVGAIVVAIGWPVTVWLAYRLGFRSQRVRMEWEAQQAKKSVHRKFIELANRFKANFSSFERPENWVEFFKDNVAEFVSDYEKIR